MHLKEYRHGLELANARMAFMKQEKGKVGMRLIKQALASTSRDEYIHRYNLYLLLLDHLNEINHGDFFKVASELETEAKSMGHTQLVQLVQIARVEAHFAQRKWDRLGAVLEECGTNLGIAKENPDPKNPWLASLTAHFLLLRGLHDGRSGQDASAKAHLKRLYGLMDDAAESGVFNEMRANGGVVKVGGRARVETDPTDVFRRTIGTAGAPGAIDSDQCALRTYVSDYGCVTT